MVEINTFAITKRNYLYSHKFGLAMNKKQRYDKIAL